jgi:hypothetical protein
LSEINRVRFVATAFLGQQAARFLHSVQDSGLFETATLKFL